ncbi:hypothetical protein N431DRAFT_3095 [Stipitochalara longipes BDJ]|nr:hypothetical protein N431DRAFT_3095 [Stipitochalara longipes BDJ]
MGTEIVTIHVGPKRKAFSVHKKLICDRSDYFSKAFNGSFKEAEGVMYLPDENTTAFDSFVTYLYQDRIPQYTASAEVLAGNFERKKLYPLFILAEKYCMNELANMVMDAIQDFAEKYRFTPSASNTRFVYNNTHESSKLRLYCVLAHLARFATKPYQEEKALEIADFAGSFGCFARDFVQLQWKHQTGLRKPTINAQVRNDEDGFGRCVFHTHAEGEVCHLENVVSGSK